MRFLIIPQLSVKRPNGYMSIADSGYMMVKHFHDALEDNDQRVATLWPTVFDKIDTDQIFREFSQTHWYNRKQGDFRTLRYGLDQDSVISALQRAEPDIVWNHIPEAAALIKSCLDAVGSSAKLVTMGFWLDLPAMDKHQKKGSGFSFAFDQLSGFLHSDIVGFSSQSAALAFFDNWTEMLSMTPESRRLIMELESKAKIFDFGYSQKEVDQLFVPPEKFDQTRFNIFFPNRLSSQGYTHAREFIEACRIAMDRGIPLRVFFTNPGKKMKQSELHDLMEDAAWCPPDDHTLTRAEYFQVMAKCELGVSLFTTERYGGCASREYAAAGLKVMWPTVNEYQLLMKQASPRDCIEVYIDEKNPRISVSDLVRGITSAYTLREVKPTGKLARVVQDRCDFAATTKGVLDTIGTW